MPRQSENQDGRIIVYVQPLPDRVFLALRWVDRNGVQRQKSAKTKNMRLANKLAGQLEIELNAEPIESFDIDEVHWDQFVSIYRRDHIKGLDRDTQNHWESVVAKVAEYGNPEMLTDVNERFCVQLSAWMNGKQHSPSTIESYLKRLRAALGWAVDHKYLAKCPVVKMPKRKRQSKRARGRALSVEEFERMQTSCEVLFPTHTARSLKHLMKMLWASGLRLEEAITLHWDREDYFHIRHLDHKHREPLIAIPWHGQKSKQDETIPCPPEFAMILRQTEPEDRVGLVHQVIGKQGKPIASVDYIGDLIQKCGEKANVVVHRYESGKTKYASAHDLRRTFATRWAEAGLSVAELQAIMRHASIETTQQYYLDIDSDRLAEKMRRWSEQHDT